MSTLKSESGIYVQQDGGLFTIEKFHAGKWFKVKLSSDPRFSFEMVECPRTYLPCGDPIESVVSDSVDENLGMIETLVTRAFANFALDVLENLSSAKQIIVRQGFVKEEF
jgi:hypothetical protein